MVIVVRNLRLFYCSNSLPIYLIDLNRKNTEDSAERPANAEFFLDNFKDWSLAVRALPRTRCCVSRVYVGVLADRVGTNDGGTKRLPCYAAHIARCRTHSSYSTIIMLMDTTRKSRVMKKVSYIMKILNNEPQKRVNDLYPLLQIIMRPKREVIPQ